MSTAGRWWRTEQAIVLVLGYAGLLLTVLLADQWRTNGIWPGGRARGRLLERIMPPEVCSSG